MRLVQIRDGALEVRWTWLPYWLAANPKVTGTIERELKDSVLLCGVTDSEADLDAMHKWVVRRIASLFPSFEGLDGYLDGIQAVKEG